MFHSRMTGQDGSGVPMRTRRVRQTHLTPLRRSWLPTVAVLGAGHGGLALAAALAANGAPVHLWNRSPGPLKAIAARGGIQLSGGIDEKLHGLAVPARVSCMMEEVLDGAEVVLVALPAIAHAEIAMAAAPYLRDGQTVLLLPGRTGGAMEFLRVLRHQGCAADVLVGEAQSFPFASRVVGPGAAAIHKIKRELPAAALPAERTAELLERCRPLLPMLVPAESVLHTSLENMGAILHPGITLLNAGRIEGGNPFRFYADGVTPAVGRFLQALDEERVRVAAAYGVRVRSLIRWLGDAYGVEGDDLRETIIYNPAYQGIGAPDTLDHRYLKEDVPTGLVPLAALAHAAGVPVPTIESAIDLASAIHRSDYRRLGRTLERLGLAGMSAVGIRDYALYGAAEMAGSVLEPVETADQTA